MNLEKRKELFLTNLKNKKEGDFSLIGEYSKGDVKTLFRHNLCGHEWETTPRVLMSSSKGRGCPSCQYREKASNTEVFAKKLQLKYPGEFSLMPEQSYYNNRTPLKFKHTVCGGIFTATPTTIIVSGSCPSCPRKVTTNIGTSAFEDKLRNERGDDYVVTSNSKYTGANNKISITHTVCGHVWDVRASHILYRSGCPNCAFSKGEEKVSAVLIEAGFPHLREHKMEGCVNKKHLPFDFALTNRKGVILGLIEYDGVQHFKPFAHFGGIRKLEAQKRNDSIKNQYCKDRNIPLLRLPYTLTDEEMSHEVLTFIKEL